MRLIWLRSAAVGEILDHTQIQLHNQLGIGGINHTVAIDIGSSQDQFVLTDHAQIILHDQLGIGGIDDAVTVDIAQNVLAVITLGALAVDDVVAVTCLSFPGIKSVA